MIAMLLAAALMGALPDDGCRATDPAGLIPPDSPSFPVAEAEPGWCLQGIDLAGQVGTALRPRMMMAVSGENSSYLLFYQTRDYRAPLDWIKVGDTIPAAAPLNGDFNEVMIQFFGRTLVVVTVNPAWRVGNAICSSEVGPITVYLGDRREGRLDDIVPGMRMSKAFAANQGRSRATTCTTAFAADGAYRLRFHDTRGHAGRSLDAAYESMRMRLVRPGNFEAYRPVRS